ncbi:MULTISPECIES: ATP synthase subunit I [Halomonadaceae]|uniref:F1F0 ATPase subunit 2 n=1 Tax=Onishia taeanensis TaxID=284577 RepID=A0A328XU88_9GAMM|nr:MULTISPECIES: ATP synthase subunit I [Halomonas]RAR62834.1 F1F0 ATPase subunit 2 [Halomonas taeanensis]
MTERFNGVGPIVYEALLTWAPAGLAGLALGAFFFGGLYWTVRRGLVSTRPARWFLASLAVRLAVTLYGFYLVAGDQWPRLLACLVGFLIARVAVTWLTRRPRSADVVPVEAAPEEATPAQEVRHAPEP